MVSPGAIAGASGSSPLARGLPDDVIREGNVRGIIPARAGFTASCGGTGPAASDHPRSRGVYGHVYYF